MNVKCQLMLTLHFTDVRYLRFKGVWSAFFLGIGNVINELFFIKNLVYIKIFIT